MLTKALALAVGIKRVSHLHCAATPSLRTRWQTINSWLTLARRAPDAPPSGNLSRTGCPTSKHTAAKLPDLGCSHRTRRNHALVVPGENNPDIQPPRLLDMARMGPWHVMQPNIKPSSFMRWKPIMEPPVVDKNKTARTATLSPGHVIVETCSE